MVAVVSSFGKIVGQQLAALADLGRLEGKNDDDGFKIVNHKEIEPASEPIYTAHPLIVCPTHVSRRR